MRPLRPRLPLLLVLAMSCCRLAADALPPAPWSPDRGDGTYQNPVLFADYSDPDAVRVGDDYYLTSSSFLHAPALPILHSRDLVNWTLIGHALPAQLPLDHFSKPRHGQGVWAPAIRFHEGRYWIFYPDPDFGLYVITATDPTGPWSTPFLLKAGQGLIDPCPFWDDDGQLYLIHGWAKSRAGIANLLSLHRLSPDAHRLLDAGENLQTTEGHTNDVGTIIVDANQLPGWRTLEGPKLYKRHGYYYVFAPAGGVTQGYQAVFRSKNIRGPYESRIVLDQGTTLINGPHQGAWVDTPGGEDWFLHFQDRGPFGRVVHLQPMVWHDDWPVIGTDPDGDGKGEPVLTHRKPAVRRPSAIAVPATSDDFVAPALGLQWQWNANPRPEWFSLTAPPGFLRLHSQPAPAPHNLYDAPHLLLQKFPAPTFTVTTALKFSPAADGESAGLIVFGFDYALLGLRRDATGTRLVLRLNLAANKPGSEEQEVASHAVKSATVYLRVTVDASAACHFSYSEDNRTFLPLPAKFTATVDRWVGAKVGLVAAAAPGATKTGHADFAWFHVTAPLAP